MQAARQNESGELKKCLLPRRLKSHPCPPFTMDGVVGERPGHHCKRAGCALVHPSLRQLSRRRWADGAATITQEAPGAGVEVSSFTAHVH